jgi:hydrogenase maturation protein HypF
VIGIAADGTGYGLDGSIWGCEILIADLADFERAGHLAAIPLAGGDQAIRQPWRVAAAYLNQHYGSSFVDLGIPFTQNLDTARWRVLAQMITRNLNSPLTSSLGRLFDGVAALIGIRNEVLYEGQAAIELEILAEPNATPYPFQLTNTSPFQIEVGPLIEAIVADLRRNTNPQRIAGRFQATVAAFLVAACVRVRASSGIECVALSGGVFQNRLLLEQVSSDLVKYGFQAYINRRVPTNDGGLSLGQAAVASAKIGRGLHAAG